MQDQLKEGVIPVPNLKAEEQGFINAGIEILVSQPMQDYVGTKRAVTTTKIENYGLMFLNYVLKVMMSPEYVFRESFPLDFQLVSTWDAEDEDLQKPNNFTHWFDQAFTRVKPQPDGPPKYTLIINFSTYAFFQMFLEQDDPKLLWLKFVKEQLIPVIKHEYTHVYQEMKMWASKNKFTDKYYNSVLQSEGQTNRFWQIYFSDPAEITAHARQAVEIFLGQGGTPEEFIRLAKTQQGQEQLADADNYPAQSYSGQNVFPAGDPTPKRFWKTAYLIASQMIDPSMNEKVVKRQGQFCVISHKSKRKFGCYDTKEEADARLRQIQHFGRQQNASMIPELHNLLKESDAQQAVRTILSTIRFTSENNDN